MKQLLFIPILVLLVSAQTYSTTDCTCSQLLSSADCAKLGSLNCSWDSTNSKCATSTTTTPTTVTYAAYCDNYSQTDCPNTTGCAWVSSKCVFFTGCTPFAKTTDTDCQAISTQCITDGTHCVKRDACSTYLKSTPCVKNASGAYCYWDTTNNVCVDASTCDKLPTTLASDSDCRTQNSICTAKTGGGCQDSGTDCSDQTTQISCVSNKLITQACYWNGTGCVDKICANAPSTLTTDDACKAFTTAGTCTTKSGGGCQARTTCSAATIQAACVTNSSGSACYWNGTACVDKTCANAPSTMTTNTACAGFLGTCITTGTGCVTNGTCSVATVQAACVTNSSGNACIWNTTCKDKTCANAPTTNTTHDACTSYLSTCTVASSGTGCQNRTCANAPATIVTNANCEAYLPNYHCVVAIGGTGCVTNAACSSLGQIACVTDVSGNACFWNGSACVDKTCTNALATYITHADCQTYSTKCTLNSTSAGCIDYTCENAQSSTVCTTDSTGNPCVYKGKCYQKQCALAPSTTTTHAACQAYLSQCTLSNTAAGCVPLPLKCEAITIQAACYLKQTPSGTAACGWNGSRCIDQDCTTIDKTIVTTANCNSAIAGCVSANPSGGVVAGCIALPSTCAGRLSQDNCEVTGTLACIWNSTGTGSCVQKTCLTALVAGTTGVLGSASATNCAGYLTGCLVNNNGDGCIAQVTACSTLTSADNCIDGAKVGGDCYWNGSTCVDKTCANIVKATHTLCQAAYNVCTVNAAGNSCQAYAALCSSYTIADQCHTNSSGKTCVWNGTTCRDQVCTDAASSASYQTVAHCEAYTVASGVCTVLPRVANAGCTAGQASCTGYLEQTQCYKDNSGAACLWHNNLCWVSSTFTCANITLATYNTANCEGVLYSCKVNGTTDGCTAKSCSDYTKVEGITAGTALSTNAECVALNSTCAIDNTGTNSCQTRQAHCAGYNTVDNCTVSDDGACAYDGSNCVIATSACSVFTGSNDGECSAFREFCKVDNDGTSGPCVSHACADKTGSNLTYALCQEYDTTCSVNNDGTACITQQATCDLYATTLASCVHSAAGACPNDGTTCIVPTATNCASMVGTGLTDTICSSYNAACLANRAGTACYIKAATCGAISSLANCTRSTAGECIGTSDTGTCTSVSASTACTAIYLGTGNYTQANCTLKNSLCTNNGTTACQAKTCANAVTATSFAACNGWLSTCTWNGSTACVAISATCASQTTTCYRATEGECVQVGTSNLCVKKTCETAATTLILASTCNSYLSTCTVAKTGGCVARSTCASYTTSLQCSKNSSASSCYWSATSSSCVDLTCANLDQTSSYNTHSLCNAALNTCTVRQSSGAVANGCQSLGTCASYTIVDQCYLNASAGACEWNTNLTTPACVDKSCTTAPISKTTHAACLAYYGSNACTVAAVAGASSNTLAGCIPLGACSSYIDVEQCHINASGSACGWNGTVCADFSCTTSPSTNNTDGLCNTYKAGCTVDQSGSGCMALLATCEAYQIEGNCVKNAANALCYWDSTNSKCITRTCDNAPDADDTDAECSAYLSVCTADSVKCKTKICEDFQLNTDALCKTSLAKCTTDGTQCVLRGTCFQALNQAGCVTDSTGAQCEWIPASGSVLAYCTNKTCATAPTDTYTTESQCAAYFTNCTAKSGGGCVIKSTCAAASQAACTTASDGTKCQWDTTANSCRVKGCQDYQGTTHAACQLISTSCTAGLNGYCATVKSCANTTVHEACIKGTDGPCLWITDSTGVGACYPYTSCKSVGWNTDSKCKQISSNCTTDGTNCAGITLCSETNVNGGCVTGYDGNCIQSVSALGSTDSPVCKAYTSCSDAFYATHSACQVASYKCTTNGTTGCIALAACSTYSQAGCYINATGAVTANGLVTSTGVCTWDTTTSACRDQVCADLTGTNHAACNAQLSTCSSDGTNCLAQSTCSVYSQTACGTAVGTDGVCIWQAITATITTAACRLMTCADVSNGISTTVCAAGLSGCVSNGTACIAKANCSTYTTQTSCNSGGLDGICVFTASTATGATAGSGTCALMTSCASANSDSNACSLAKTRCAWTAASGSGATAVTSKCATHTCATYQQTNAVCANFLNWAKTLQQVCTIKSGVCSETDPTTLAQTDCYQVSSYTYTWNASTSKCAVCTTSTSTNNTTNTTNTTNSTTTDSGFILSWATIVLGYLMF